MILTLFQAFFTAAPPPPTPVAGPNFTKSWPRGRGVRGEREEGVGGAEVRGGDRGGKGRRERRES
jgi:hypothetical protein